VLKATGSQTPTKLHGFKIDIIELPNETDNSLAEVAEMIEIEELYKSRFVNTDKDNYCVIKDLEELVK
jgi:hypothetical protein